MRKKAARVIIVGFVLIYGTYCRANISEDFESYTAPQLPAASLGDWRVYDGAVDLVGTGTGHEYYPPPLGQGLYIDLVGTGGAAPGTL
jgi:hypothetical protein